MKILECSVRYVGQLLFCLYILTDLIIESCRVNIETFHPQLVLGIILLGKPVQVHYVTAGTNIGLGVDLRIVDLKNTIVGRLIWGFMAQLTILWSCQAVSSFVGPPLKITDLRNMLYSSYWQRHQAAIYFLRPLRWARQQNTKEKIEYRTKYSAQN